MTKKHFQAFANQISEMESNADAVRIALLCCDVFADDNHRFDAVRFLQACTPAIDSSDSIFSSIS